MTTVERNLPAFAGTLRGVLARAIGCDLPVEVLRSQAGYYIGTRDADGPVSRESRQYWRSEKEAAHALAEGLWTQRLEP